MFEILYIILKGSSAKEHNKFEFETIIDNICPMQKWRIFF